MANDDYVATPPWMMMVMVLHPPSLSHTGWRIWVRNCSSFAFAAPHNYTGLVLTACLLLTGIVLAPGWYLCRVISVCKLGHTLKHTIMRLHCRGCAPLCRMNCKHYCSVHFYICYTIITSFRAHGSCVQTGAYLSCVYLYFLCFLTV